MNAWPFILTFVAGLAHAETNVDPKTDLVEAWGTSDKCPGYLRLRAEKEDKSAYWIDNLPLSHPKLDGLEANVSVSNVEILAQGCDTKPEPTFNPETDVYTEAVFPDNVTLPLKPMGSIPKLDKIDEDDLSPKLLAFLNDVRAALRKDKVLNDEKPIIVYGTASAARPSCQVEPGYEKFIEKSFDQKDRLSNVELAYKRALSTAVILKKFIVDYAAADDKKKYKIEVRCGVNSTKQKVRVFGMLKQGHALEVLNKTYTCGEEIKFRAMGFGVGAPPSRWQDTEKFFENKVNEEQSMKATESGLTYSRPRDADAKINLDAKFRNGTTFSYQKCYDKVKNNSKEKVLSTDKSISPQSQSAQGGDQVYSQPTTVKDKNGKNTFLKGDDGKVLEIKTVSACRTQACKWYLTDVEPKDWQTYTLTYCLSDKIFPDNSGYAATDFTKGVRPLPGNSLVIDPAKQDLRNSDNNYTLRFEPMRFKKGDRLHLNFDALQVPDRFIVTVNSKRVIDTGYVSNNLPFNKYDDELRKKEKAHVVRVNQAHHSLQPAETGIDYYFENDTPNADVKMFVFGPFVSTLWSARLSCPDDQSVEPGLFETLRKKYKVKRSAGHLPPGQLPANQLPTPTRP